MFLIIALIFLIVLSIFFKWHYSYWSRKNVDGPTPLPFFGNMIEYVFARKHHMQVYDDIYREYHSAKYVGVYKMSAPAILIRDLDLVKNVLVSDFSSFSDNDFIVDPKMDSLLSSSPFVCPTSTWKTARSQLIPLFSAGKVRQIYPNIKNVCDQLVDYIDGNSNDFEAKVLCSRYTINNIASCAFGVDGQTFTTENSKFYDIGRKLFPSSMLSHIRTMLALFVPFITKIIRTPFIAPECDQWIREMVTDILDYRTKNKETRNDLLQAIYQLKERGDIDTETMMGHALLFLFEGYETSSTLMEFSLYYIAKNKQIQKKLQNEIDDKIEKFGGLTEEAINELQYLDLVFLETLRLHCPVFTLQKLCRKSYKLPPQYSDSKDSVVIEEGTPVIIPLHSIHRDNEYYEKPSVFDPERHTEENRADRKKYSFLGFGEGPRICLGMKFGMTQSKAGIASILANFDVNLSTKTVEPLEISTKTFLLASRDGIFVNFTKRQ